jgi:hypothetical protein
LRVPIPRIATRSSVDSSMSPVVGFDT